MILCEGAIWKLDLLKIILLVQISYHFSLGQSLRNACQHNQFRCSDNGRCLSTEALCNGRRDCSNGEDEGGGQGWNCRSLVLSKDYCDSAWQFRCRFGGCVSRTSLCDGRVDCWGGGDESWEICNGGKPVIPQVSGGNSVSNPRPAPPQAIRTPPPQRATAPPTVAATSRPRVPSSGGGSGACGPIREDASLGYQVVCENSRGYDVPCDDAPSGAIAQYRCNKLYNPVSSIVQTALRRCEGGRWSPLNNRFGCEAECGISSSDTGAFIVGGSTAMAGRWPWMVAIYENSAKRETNFICGASLISARAVITAAHCLVRRHTGRHKPLRDLTVVMGKYYRSFDKNFRGEQVRTISQIFVHPDYNDVTLTNDIAIIKLSEAVEITSTVRPVCLPTFRDYTDPGQFGTLVGWGRGDGKSFQEQLQQAQLPMILSQKCIEAHPQFAQLVHQGTFCAGYRNGTSACDGDSGGPLVFRDRYSPGKWVLHGVVSAGIAASDGRAGCNPNYYTVFTDVGYTLIRRWIDLIIDSNFSS